MTISTKDEYRIVAQCSNSTRLFQAISAFPGCVAIVAASLKTDLEKLRSSLAQSASRAIAVVERYQPPNHLPETFLGVVSRDIDPSSFLQCVRAVTDGRSWIATEFTELKSLQEDPVGIRVRNRLTTREMRVAALLLEGYKNREISLRLGTKEQVIKNCFRSIYEKSGASDRLEMALFINHHQELAKAVAAAAREINAEEWTHTCSTAVA